jgi:hypothetical protein
MCGLRTQGVVFGDVNAESACRVGLPGSFQERQPRKGRLGRYWNNRKYLTIKLGLPRAKELLRKLSAISACTVKNIRQPCPGPK